MSASNARLSLPDQIASEVVVSQIEIPAETAPVLVSNSKLENMSDFIPEVTTGLLKFQEERGAEASDKFLTT